MARELLDLVQGLFGHGTEVASPERTEREQFSTSFEGMPDHQLAVGGAGTDSFGGTAAADHYWGFGGADKLGGGPEGDVLTGGDGPDLLVGGPGTDHLHGGAGNASLYGGPDGDALMGGPGNDFLDEGPGHSSVDGEEGNDTLVGGPGPDAFIMRQGSGDDVIRDFTAGPGVGDHIALEGIRWADLTINDTAAGVKISWDGGSVLLAGVQK